MTNIETPAGKKRGAYKWNWVCVSMVRYVCALRGRECVCVWGGVSVCVCV